MFVLNSAARSELFFFFGEDENVLKQVVPVATPNSPRLESPTGEFYFCHFDLRGSKRKPVTGLFILPCHASWGELIMYVIRS